MKKDIIYSTNGEIVDFSNLLRNANDSRPTEVKSFPIIFQRIFNVFKNISDSSEISFLATEARIGTINSRLNKNYSKLISRANKLPASSLLDMIEKLDNFDFAIDFYIEMHQLVIEFTNPERNERVLLVMRAFSRSGPVKITRDILGV